MKLNSLHCPNPFFSKPLEYTSSDFVVRLNNRKFKYALLSVTIPILFVIIIRWETFMKGPVLQSIFVFFFFGSAILYFLLGMLNKSPRIVISTSGILTKKLMLKWGEIEYFYIEEKKTNAENRFFFHFKRRDTDKEFKVETTEFDKSYTDIYSAIMNYSKGHNIIELVHSIDQ